MTAAPLQHLPARVRRSQIEEASLDLGPRAAAAPDDEQERLADWALEDWTNLGAALGLERCPGLLIVHADGLIECVEGTGCAPDPGLHIGTIPCAELPGCC